ncbi:MAG: hypothetical protein ABSG21_17120, partial [Spirochaetia bacterium]
MVSLRKMSMMLFTALILALAPNPAGAEVLHISIAVAPDAVGRLPGAPVLQSGIQHMFAAEFGAFASLAFDAEQSADLSAAAPDPSARILLGVSGDAVTVSTDFMRSRTTRSLVSTVPAESPASLLATIAGDLAYLSIWSRGFSTLPLSPPPSLV